MQINLNLIWHLISSLGNLAPTTTLVIIIAFWLLSQRARTPALAWCALFGTAMLLVLASKIAFIGWGIGSETLDFTGISGHATRAAAVFPVLFYLGLRSNGKHWQSALPGVALATLIALSRVVVHAHSGSEAIAGWLIGCAVSFLFIVSYQLPPRTQPSQPRFSRWLLASSLVALAFISPFETVVNTNSLIRQIALVISRHNVAVTREIWGKKPR